MIAGFSRQDITPPMGTPLQGSGSAQDRLAQSIQDPIYTRALAFEHEGQRGLIMGFDLCFFSRFEADRLKGVLARELEILPRQVLLNASHSHSGPAASIYTDMTDAPPLLEYQKQLEVAVVRAAREAFAAMTPVTLHAAMGRTEIPMNRRLLKNGKIELAPNPSGPVLHSLPVCRFDDSQGRCVCLLFAASAHPVCVRNAEVSADFPGVAMHRIDAHFQHPCSLFLQGAGCGNTRPALLSLGEKWNWRSTIEDAKRIGVQLATETISTLSQLKPVEAQVRSVLIEISFPLAPPDVTLYQRAVEAAKVNLDLLNPSQKRDLITAANWGRRQLSMHERGRLPSTFNMLVQGMQLARGVRIVALECEPMVEHALAIENFFTAAVSEKNSTDITIALGYSNGDGMYLVTSTMLDEGGYETNSFGEYGQPAPLAKGVETHLHEALLRLQKSGIH